MREEKLCCPSGELDVLSLGLILHKLIFMLWIRLIHFEV